MTVKENQPQSHRKRGVQASRTKLVHALNSAGLRTQAALAERIADLEELTVAPKDLVNRAFRELSVDPQTLDRIATALKVDVHTLYKSADEPVSPTPNRSEPVEAPRELPASAAQIDTPKSKTAWFVALAVGAVALLATGWYLAPTETASNSLEVVRESPHNSNALSLGATSVVVMPIDMDNDGLITSSLRQALSENYNVATPTAIAAAQTNDPQEIAEKLRVDIVIYGEVLKVGSLVGVRIYGSTDSGRQQIWSESLPVNQLEARSANIAQHIVAAMQAVTSDSPPATPAPYFAVAAVQDDYLQGQQYLEKPASELNIKRAQSRFSSALRQDPEYAKAHAGLCLALLEEFWMGDEERALNDAAGTCGEAMALAPEDSVVAIAHAYFLRRSGRNDEAIDKFEQIVEREPDNAVALVGLASTLLQSFRQNGEKAQLNRAIAMSKRSVEANPESSRAYNTLLNLQWFAGNIKAAIDAAENSIKFEENELALVNLGTLYLCSGSLEKARSTYERAVAIAPESYIGREFLGQAMYFLGDFATSADLRRKAIESITDGVPEIHEMWGNLGDSYRQTGNTAGAIGAYVQASRIAERDHLRGNAAIADRASRAYYYTMLRSLDHDTVSDDVYNAMLQELDEISAKVTETSALRRLAQTWLQLGQRQKAQDTLSKVTATCPGYAMMPDLTELGTNQ